MTTSAIQIKGNCRQGLIIQLDLSGDLEELKQSLLNKLLSSNGFFKGARVALKYSTAAQVDGHLHQELEQICLKNGLIIAEAAEPVSTAAPNLANVLYHGNLRSGQRLVHQGAVVLVGNVNPGAEIVAGDDIMVIGALQGIAHAGVTGNRKARIIAHQMQAQQLRIANFVARSLESSVQKTQPEIAYLDGETIVIDSWHANSPLKRTGIAI